MNLTKVTGLMFIIVGILGLVYGSFTYIKSTHTATLGPVEVLVKDKQEVTVPLWAGIGSIMLGSTLFFIRTKKG